MDPTAPRQSLPERLGEPLSPREERELELQRASMENEGGGVVSAPNGSERAHERAQDRASQRDRGPMAWLKHLLHRPRLDRSLDLHWYDGQIALGRSPDQRELELLARKHGIRAVLDLDTEGEEGQVLSPNVEASWAEAFELQHRRASIDPGLLRSEDADRFLDELRSIQKPVYVHSRRGRRAAALMILWLAVERHRTGNEAVAEARELGIECESEHLREFAASEANRRFAARAMRQMSRAV
jgi:protein tyrosine phosphatase (PTP) superfamily phosphohydrolase (DUF442 family)